MFPTGIANLNMEIFINQCGSGFPDQIIIERLMIRSYETLVYGIIIVRGTKLSNFIISSSIINSGTFCKYAFSILLEATIRKILAGIPCHAFFHSQCLWQFDNDLRFKYTGNQQNLEDDQYEGIILTYNRLYHKSWLEMT